MAVIDLKADLVIGLILASVHLLLSGGFAAGFFRTETSFPRTIPGIGAIFNPDNYLTVSITACVAMVIILGVAVYDVYNDDK
jgi:hypothetical protein